jgi:hypothetical protein
MPRGIDAAHVAKMIAKRFETASTTMIEQTKGDYDQQTEKEFEFRISDRNGALVEVIVRQIREPTTARRSLRRRDAMDYVSERRAKEQELALRSWRANRELARKRFLGEV